MQPLRETAGQGDTLLALVYAGLAAAMLCDMLMPLARRCGAVIRFGMQLLLCACGAFFCFLALERTGCGTLRPYMLLSFGAGCLLWRLGVRKAVCSAIKLLRRNRKNVPGGE